MVSSSALLFSETLGSKVQERRGHPASPLTAITALTHAAAAMPTALRTNTGARERSIACSQTQHRRQQKGILGEGWKPPTLVKRLALKRPLLDSPEQPVTDEP